VKIGKFAVIQEIKCVLCVTENLINFPEIFITTLKARLKNFLISFVGEKTNDVKRRVEKPFPCWIYRTATTKKNYEICL
jgi:hypothetical protein